MGGGLNDFLQLFSQHLMTQLLDSFQIHGCHSTLFRGPRYSEGFEYLKVAKGRPNELNCGMESWSHGYGRTRL